ncbi:MAG: penicillin-binding protein activator [Parahaliea sp.]
MRSLFTAPRARLLLALLCVGLLLSACADSPRQDPGRSEHPTLPTQGDPGLAATSQAEHSLPESVHAREFQFAEAYLAAFDWPQAERSLEAVREPLDTNDLTYYRYLQARIAWLHGRQREASALLEGLPLPQTAPALVDKVVNFQRHRLHVVGNYRESARLGSRLLAQDPLQAAASTLKRNIWRDLSHLPAEQLGDDGSSDPQWRDWLALARITAAEHNASALEPALRRWREAHPEHPAAHPLPGGLGALLDQPLNPKTVALLLPLSGRLAPAARAVLEGYLAAFYEEYGSAGQRELLVLDTNAHPSAAAAYDEAVRRGASLVVGPLSKQGVTELGRLAQRPVPVLTLNRSDESFDPGTTALVQLSLSPEDEAATLARMAWGQGARQALIVRPAGDWGDKLEAALLPQWRALGGSAVGSTTYTGSESYSDSIKQLFQVQTSEQRAQDIRAMLATDIQYKPRRRQDFDAIFLLSGSPAEARALKPLLAFHYAGDVPVYASSAIYSGIPGRGDRDLNGIRLAELPWLLGTNPGIRVAIAAGGTGSDRYTRLNALGTDAYLLQSRFAQLQAGADALLRGSTGLLSMDPELRILREPLPATFDGGHLKPL